MEKYEHLEGKEVIIRHIHGEEDRLIVVGIEEDIGITLAKAENKLENVICINGPLSPKRDAESSMPAFYAMFGYLVNALEEGFIDASTLIGVKSEAVGFPVSASGGGGLECAFS